MQRTFARLMPNDVASDSIRIILNTPDEKERDTLTEKWRSHKLEELNFIGIVVCEALLLWTLAYSFAAPHQGHRFPVQIKLF